MIPFKDREQMRQEIRVCCKKLFISTQMADLCEKEATPKQEEFLHKVMMEEAPSASWPAGTA